MSDSHNIQVGTVYNHPQGQFKVESMDTRYSEYSNTIKTDFRLRWTGSTAVRISTLLDEGELLSLILECKTEE